MRSTVIQLSGLLVLGLGTDARAQGSDEVRCNYSARSVCSRAGCAPSTGIPAFLVVPPLESLAGAALKNEGVEVRRCDRTGCTPIRVSVTLSGAYLNLAAPDRGYMLKLSLGSNPHEAFQEFVEVATLMAAAYVGSGSCVAR